MKIMPSDFPRTGRLAGIDYGTARIGLAVSDPERRLASPLDTYQRRGAREDAEFFRRLVEQEGITGFVVGLPVHTSGRESQRSVEARTFGRWLADATGLAVRFYDERFTTEQAEEHLEKGKLSRASRARRRDMLAAQLILAAFLESDQRGQDEPGPLE
jgi:putative Holliday junction resolvase